MRTKLAISGVLTIVLSVCYCSGTLAEEVDVVFGKEGPKAIQQGEAQWALKEGLRVRSAIFRKEGGSTYKADLKSPKRSFYPGRHLHRLRHKWGEVACTYVPREEGLGMTIVVYNNSSNVLHRIKIGLPTFEVGQEARGRGSHHNVGAPTVLTARWDDGVAALCNEQIDRPLNLSLSTKEDELRGALTSGGDRMVYDDVFLSRPIPPGESDHYEISFRFGAPGTNPHDLAGDVYSAFRRAHPRLLNWPDRRPINRVFFRGGWPKKKIIQWFKDSESVDLPEKAPEKFRKKIMRSTEHTIARAKKANAQGVIVWNMEGSSFPHPTTYIGDPRMTRVFNPYMDAVADEMFQRIHDAGLLSGVCIRPSQVVYEEKNKTVNQRYGPVLEKYPDDPAFNQLNDKITYCRERWGTRIFYIDTAVFWQPRGPKNQWKAGWVTADVWRRLLQKHPNILLIPEFGYTQDMAYTSLYWEFDCGFRGVPERMKRVYPDCWATAVIEDMRWFVPKWYDMMVRNVRNDNALMTFGWIAPQRRIYDEAAFLDAGMPESVRGASAEKLVKLLKSDDARARFYAAAELGAEQEARDIVVPALIEALKDEETDWHVRKNAIVSLGQLGAPEAVDPLLAVFEMRKARLQRFAAEALVEIGAPALPAVLKKVRGGSQPAIVAARQIDGERIVPVLAEGLENERGGRSFRRAAGRTLGNVNSKKAVTVLIRVLKNEELHQHTRGAAASGLARTGRGEARKVLEQVRENLPEGKKYRHLRRVLDRSLNRMKKK